MASINPAQALSMGVDAVYLSDRPLPIAPTGYYDWQVSSNPAEKRQGHSGITNLINKVRPPSN
jgi:linoleate 10R-lipoxygenase